MGSAVSKPPRSRAEIARENGKKGGRPKGSKDPQTLAKEMAREALRVMVTAEMAPMVRAQIAQAKGLSYLVVRDKATGQFVRVHRGRALTLKPGEEIVEVWSKDPSTLAFKDLMDRALDKAQEPAQNVNVTVEGALALVPERLAAARRRLAERKE